MLVGIAQCCLALEFIEVIRQGFVMPTLIAFIVVYIPMSAFLLWWAGGVKRSIAQQMLLYWASFLLLGV